MERLTKKLPIDPHSDREVCGIKYLDIDEACKKLYEYEKAGKIFIIRPLRTYVKTFELSKENLENAYTAGYNVAQTDMSEILDFLVVERINVK